MKLFVAVVLAASLATSVLAQSPNPLNFRTGVEIRVGGAILCDTQEQMESILTAQQDSWSAGLATFHAYQLTRNEFNEPNCYFYAKPVLSVRLGRTVSTFENVKFPDKTMTFHVQEIQWDRRGAGWTLGYIATDWIIQPAGDPT